MDELEDLQEQLEDKYEEVKQLIIAKKAREFRAAIEDIEPVDIANIIDGLDEEYQVLAFRMLPKDCATDVFAYFPNDTQEKIITSITDKEISTIIEDLYVDDAVDMLDELPATVVNRILKNAKPETRATLNQFLKYADDSAGSIMTSEYIDIKKNLTVAQAIARIRKIGKEKESIYTCFVTDESRHLIGVTGVKDLLLADDDSLVESIMNENVIACKTSDDQESVSKILQKYDYLSLPVVDNEDRLVGIITIDDAVDVIQEEAEEDFEKMAAIVPSDKPYFDMSVFEIFKHRIVWLLILMVTGMVTGGILESYESAISSLPLLVAFLPMLNDTGGNSGSQAATMIIRGLTTGDVQPKEWLKAWWKEFRVSIIVGFSLALFNFVRIIIFYNKGIFPNAKYETAECLKYALVICGSLFIAVIIAKSIGALLPILAKVLKLDPAVCAAPMITTIVDCCTILVYFSLACVVFNI